MKQINFMWCLMHYLTHFWRIRLNWLYSGKGYFESENFIKLLPQGFSVFDDVDHKFKLADFFDLTIRRLYQKMWFLSRKYQYFKVVIFPFSSGLVHGRTTVNHCFRQQQEPVDGTGTQLHIPILNPSLAFDRLFIMWLSQRSVFPINFFRDQSP